MKKIWTILTILLITLFACGFAFFSSGEEEFKFDVNDLYNYQKQFESEEIEICSTNSTKTYMDYRATSDASSIQYRFIRNKLTVDRSGFLYDQDGFIGVALGSYYGNIGDRYYVTLDTGIVLPLVKCEAKADGDVYNGCYHKQDNSVIEFVIDSDLASEYFGMYGNGLVLQGNFNNYDLFSGNIVKMEKVLDTKIGESVTYSTNITNLMDSFNYASGY